MDMINISFGVFELFITSIVFCVTTVVVARKFGRRGAWIWWGVAVFAAILVYVLPNDAWLRDFGNPLVMIYTLAMIYALPTAAAVWMSARSVRGDRPGPFGHFVRTYGMFVLGTIVGVVLGLVPDFAKLF